MKELVEKISVRCDLSMEHAANALDTVASFVKEQYPLLSITVDNVLGTGKSLNN